MNKEDIYRLLGIHVYAPAETVKRRFREFALNNHPDLFPGDRVREERFKKVTAAYQTWKLIQCTVGQISRLRNASRWITVQPDDFKPWSFSCKA